jgi:hypothetical protein
LHFCRIRTSYGAQITRFVRVFVLIGGLALTTMGLFGIIAYIAGVIDIIVSQPADRSWLFWGLGLAAIGLTLVGAGIGLLLLWRKTRSDV